MRPSKANIIYTGDSGILLKDKNKFPNNSIDLVITSPPYVDRRNSSYGGIKPEKYVEWLTQITSQLYRILKPRGSFVLNIKEGAKNGEKQTYVIELILALKDQGWFWIEEYCWYKKNSHPGKWPNRFRDSWERCLHFSKSKNIKMYQNAVRVPIGDWSKKRFRSLSEKDFVRSISANNNGFGRNVSKWLKKKKVYPPNVLDFEKEHYYNTTNVIHLSTECSNRNHSAAFPLELPTWFIKLFTRKGNLVLDPFIGVGTSAIASKLLAREFIGIDLKKEYTREARKNLTELKSILPEQR